AAAGETVSFSLSGVVTSDASGNETNETGAYAATATVAAPAQPTSEPTSQPTSQPSNEPTSQPTSNPGSNPSASASASAKAGGLDDVPKTGDTTTDIMLFAVIGLAAAATVAIVAGKKALSHK
ncbi:MAG: PT domain-containing protein, partial [Christensenella hongkongensis]